MTVFSSKARANL